MKEVEYQSLIIKEIRRNRGFAFKCSNRFLIGVPDLFVKLSDTPPAFIEVKVDRWPSRSRIIRPNVSPAQSQFLRNAATAGVAVGVMSIAEINSSRVAAWVGRDEEVASDLYRSAPKAERSRLFYELLHNYLINCTL